MIEQPLPLEPDYFNESYFDDISLMMVTCSARHGRYDSASTGGEIR
jgi:hypothetical protein